jgi:pimeloyl-ACP methyl ester carboxylesterase
MTTCKEETIKVRGRKTRLLRGGDGPPLLFLHDPFCPSWLPLHDKLAAEHEVLLPIHPGFAGSDDGFDKFDEMEDVLFHYLDLCEALDIERPGLVGASFGGWIAAEWAIRYGDRLRALILIDALGLRLDGAPAADILNLDGAAMRRILFADPGSALAMATLPDTPNTEDMVSTILARRTLARFAWQFPDNPRLRRYLYRVHVPTLILWGERDGYVSLAHGNAYQEGIARSEFRAVENAGHLPHIEAADACGNLILAFLGKNGG